MKRLIYHAPAHYVLYENGEQIRGGEEFTATDNRALELLTDPALDVFEAPEGNLDELTRAELDERAAQAGLDPKDYRNKADLIDALTDPAQNEGEVSVTDPGIHPQPDSESDGPPQTDSNQEG